MKNVLPILLLLAAAFTAQAQVKIAVQADSNTVAFYTDLQTAIDAAAPNSTVYLSGGSFALSSSYVVAKPLNFVGVGYNADSTVATNQTTIPQIKFGTGSNGATITGCYVTGDITINTGVANIGIRRCNINAISLNNASNIIISENIVRGSIYGTPAGATTTSAAANNILIYKNIIYGQIYLFQQSSVSNNLLLYENASFSYGSIWSIHQSIFKNNYFLRLGGFNNNNCTSCTFNNNVTLTYQASNFTNCVFNNLLTTNTTLASTFQNVPNNASYPDINYQIKSTSPAKNYGTDGTDIGIFGTSKPWKKGGLPDYPHVYFINIADENTGPNGTLPVQVKVSAQSSN